MNFFFLRIFCLWSIFFPFVDLLLFFFLPFCFLFARLLVVAELQAFFVTWKTHASPILVTPARFVRPIPLPALFFALARRYVIRFGFRDILNTADSNSNGCYSLQFFFIIFFFFGVEYSYDNQKCYHVCKRTHALVYVCVCSCVHIHACMCARACMHLCAQYASL